MTPNQLTRLLLLNCPISLYNRFEVLKYIFCTSGNGFKWSDGEITGDFKDMARTTHGAVEKYLRRTLNDSFSSFIGQPNDKKTQKVLTDIAEDKIERVILPTVYKIFETLYLTDDMTVPEDFGCFWISPDILLCNIPDNVSKEWLTEIRNLLDIISEYPDKAHDHLNLLPQIHQRVSELEKSKQTITDKITDKISQIFKK